MLPPLLAVRGVEAEQEIGVDVFSGILVDDIEQARSVHPEYFTEG